MASMIHSLKRNKSFFILFFAGCLLAFLLSEGILSVYRIVIYGKVARQELIMFRKGLKDDVIGGKGERWKNRLVLHPLFGYTYNPTDDGTGMLFNLREIIEIKTADNSIADNLSRRNI